MNGSVYRRSRLAKWEYRFDLGPDSLTGRRRTTTKTGFATKKEASHALRVALSGP